MVASGTSLLTFTMSSNHLRLGLVGLRFAEGFGRSKWTCGFQCNALVDHRSARSFVKRSRAHFHFLSRASCIQVLISSCFNLSSTLRVILLIQSTHGSSSSRGSSAGSSSGYIVFDALLCTSSPDESGSAAVAVAMRLRPCPRIIRSIFL